jgi:hypothetical protein
MADNLISDLRLNAEHQLLVIEDYRRAADRIEKLEVLLDLYRDAVTVDATMQGPIFRGANSYALKRAWYHDRKALEGKDD